MSQVYSTEPQTAGRVIFETTHGPLEINLWSRECPATTKYFLQLCLDGYYENVLFHRIVPNFLVQTGALRYNPVPHKGKASQPSPVTSLDGSLKELQQYRQRAQANEAFDRRSYELNTRIRFNHRGQVAMALAVETGGMGDDEVALMQPQFFITLDEASELDGKHVCFGTVAGPTIFNALRIGNTDVDEESGQPTILEEAPRIERVKILENPIHTDIVPSQGVLPWQARSTGEDAEDQKKKKKRRGVKNLNVLSFGDEMEQDPSGGSGIKSSHDVIETKRFSKKVDKKLEEVVAKNGEENTHSNDDSEEILPRTKKQKFSNESEDFKSFPDNGSSDATPSQAGHVRPISAPSSVAYKAPSERRVQEPKEQKNVQKVKEDENTKEKAPKVSLVEARRAKYAKRGQKDKKKREKDTMAKFMAFQSKVTTKTLGGLDVTDEEKEDDGIAIRMAKRVEKDESDGQKGEDSSHTNAATYFGQVLENDDDAERDWMRTRFKCRKHQDLDAKLGGDGRNAMEDYEVVDEKDRGFPGAKKERNRHNHNQKKEDKHKHISR